MFSRKDLSVGFNNSVLSKNKVKRDCKYKNGFHTRNTLNVKRHRAGYCKVYLISKGVIRRRKTDNN
jgi:hypothetical protein